MSPPPARGRGLLQRPLLLFGCLLLVPAAGFAWLGWASLVGEHAALERDRVRAASEALEAQTRAALAGLERLKQREARRPYYEYQTEVLLTDARGQDLVVQPGPFTRPSEDPRVLGWFQWEAGAKGAFEAPELFGPEASSTLRGLLEGYGAALRARIDGASSDPDLRAAHAESVPLNLVQANEERGQLIEELEARRRQPEASAAAPESAGQGLPPGQAAGAPPTPYLSSFARRAGEEPVPVRATRFQYLARAGAARGPPLVAWRLVWIPAVYAERRELARDRWLLQGYGLDPGRGADAGWTRVGAALVGWRERLPDADLAPEGLLGASLAEALEAETLGSLSDVAPALLLVARPDEAAAEQAWRTARVRFVLLVGALVCVTAVGFALLVRGVRKEVALARRKEDFVAAVTHELKTPLTGIRMFAELLEQGWVDTPEAAQGYARRIIEECGRLGHLVDQVLDLAALERGVRAVEPAPGDLGEAVRSAVGLLHARAKAAGVTLEVEVEPGLPPCPFDARLLRPLVLNLVENAIKYSERAEAKQVTVSVARAGDRLVLTVRDRGVGIAADAQRRLFQPFQRGMDEMTRAAPGVGIGLALVKRYADAHRAKVTLASEPGVGTAVTVRFPL